MRLALPAFILFALSSVLLPGAPVLGAPPGDGRSATILDLQGTALVSPAGRDRWTPVSSGAILAPGDRLRTLTRGANVVEVAVAGAGRVVLGPGSTLELGEAGEVGLLRGEAEFVALEGRTLRVTRPEPVFTVEEEPSFFRVRDGVLEKLAEPFGWLVGYRGNTTGECLGSLVARVDGRNVPLAIGYHKVSVVIRDQIAETTIEESFVNSTKRQLEGIFTFPLPADASISGFGMWIGGELVMADIVERRRARAIYEDIRRGHKDPGLLEWSGGNLFKARVFPIPGRSEKRIRIRYTQVLPREGTKIRYRHALRSEMLRAHPLRALSIRVRMVAALPVLDAASPSHVVTKEASEHEVRLSLDADEVVPDRDFEAVFTMGAIEPLTVLSHRRGPDGYFALLLSPPDPAGVLTRRLAPESDPLDLVLLADTSGSMDAAARESQADFLEALLGLLGSRDTFRLGAFDGEVTWIVPEARPVSERNVSAALEALSARDSLGWTDLDLTLAAAAEVTGPDTHVVLMGDGIGTSGDPDAAALMRRVERFAANARGTFHAVATGSSHERGVLEAVAAVGGGSVREVASDPVGTAYALLTEIAAPVVRDLAVSFEGVRTARVYPDRLPNLPAGRQQVILGRFLPGESGTEGTVSVTGTLLGRPVRFTAPFRLAASESGNSFLPRLWARRHLDVLLRDALTPVVRDEIVSFSAEFGIMTPLTSFLVLESDEDRARYGVDRRVAMRDGERFFAEAKDQVDARTLGRAIRVSGLWRKNLRRLAVREIADLGRGLYPISPSWAYAPGVRGAGDGAESGDSATFGPGGGLLPGAKLEPGGDSGEDTDLAELPALDVPVVAPDRTSGDPLPPFEGPGTPLPMMDAARSTPGVPGGKSARRSGSYRGPSSGGRGRYRNVLEHSPEEQRRQIARAALLRFIRGFPYLRSPRDRPAPPDPEGWTEELRVVASALDRTAAGTALSTGLAIESVSASLDPESGERRAADEQRILLSPECWLIREASQNRSSRVEWCGPARRAVLSLWNRLGRHLKATPADRELIRNRPFMFFLDPLRSYRSWSGSVVDRSDTSLTLRFTRPENGAECLLEVDRGLMLPTRSVTRRTGRPVFNKRWSDWTFVGGLPFPGLTEVLDAEGRVTWRRRLTVAEHTADEIRARVAEVEANSADGLFLPPILPELPAAMRAVRDGEAGLAERLVILADHTGRRGWDEAPSAWKHVEELVAGKPGGLWLEATFLAVSRRGDETLALLSVLARRLHQAPTLDAQTLAEEILDLGAIVLGVDQQLLLLDELCLVPALRESWTRGAVRRAGLLEKADRREEGLSVRKELVAAHPRDLALAHALSEALVRLRLVEEAIDVIEVALACEPSGGDGYVSALYRQLTELLWRTRRLDDLAAAAEDWLTRQPGDSDAWRRTWAAKSLTKRDAEVEAEVLGVLDVAGTADLSEDDRSRLDPAIDLALGRGWAIPTYTVSPAHQEALGGAALRLVRNGDSRTRPHGLRILGHMAFRRTDVWKRVREELHSDLFTEASLRAMEPDRLHGLILLFLRRPWATTEEELDLLALVVGDRWSACGEDDIRRRLGAAWVELQDMRGRREDAAGALWWRLAAEEDPRRRVQLANSLLDRLLDLPHTALGEEEIFGLLPAIVAAQADEVERAGWFANAAWAVARGLYEGRVEAALGPPEEREKLPRAELRARRLAARDAARTALAGRFALATDDAFKAGPDQALLAPWLRIEAIGFAVQSAPNDRDIEARVREWLLATPNLPHRALRRLYDERLSLALDHLAIRSDAPEGLVDRVAALHRERSEDAAGAVREQRRRRRVRFLLAIDRPAELEAALVGWIASGGAPTGYRVALARLLAERGDLVAAVAELETVARADELGMEGYSILADWYLALGEPKRREWALDRRAECTPEELLRARMRGELTRLARRGPDGVTEDLDPDIFRTGRSLLSKATRPSRPLGDIRRLYEITKEFRLLAMLADGIEGRSPEVVYPYLGECRRLLSRVHEQATLDEVSDRIEERANAGGAATDRRGYLLLAALVHCRAAEVMNRPELHVDKALNALKAAYPAEWSPGEPRLLAELLSSLGRLESEPLAREQLRQLELIHLAADPATADGLSIAVARAGAIWGYDPGDEAIDMLDAALASKREAAGGRLPRDVFNHVDTLAAWLERLERFSRAEAWLTAERERQTGEDDARAWLTLRLFTLHGRALAAGGELSVGSGEALYCAAFREMAEALVGLPAGQVEPVLTHILGLARIAHGDPARCPGVAADLADLARQRLREALARVPDREQTLWLRVAETVRRTGDPLTALALLVEKIESDGEEERRKGRDGWSRFAHDMARWRAEIAVPAPLAERLLVIVLDRLERALTVKEAYGSNIWQSHSSEYWREREDDFLAVARRVVSSHPDSPAILLRTAGYLWGGAGRRAEAVQVLLDLDGRGGLPEELRLQVGSWLMQLERHREAAGHFMQLVEGDADHLVARRSLVACLHAIGDDERARSLVDEGADRLREQGVWNCSTMGQMADTSFACDYMSRAARFYGEEVREYERLRSGRDDHANEIARIYGRLARSLVALGREEEAVSAGAAGVVVFGRTHSARSRALAELQAVLSGLSDLDGYVRDYEAEVARTGLDAPVIRKALGLVYLERSDWKSAAAQLRTARDLVPEDPDLHRSLMQALARAGERAAATDALRAWSRACPSDYSLLITLADRLRAEGAATEVERVLCTLVERNPLEAEGHRRLAGRRESEGRYDEALVQRRIARDLRAFDPRVWFELAETLRRADRRDEERKVLEEIISRSWRPEFRDPKRRAAALLAR